MIKTVLLTGATGFIGSHLLEELLDKNYQVVILKRSFSDPWRIKKFLAHVKAYDIDKKGVELAFQDNKIETLIHLAAKYVKSNESQQDISEMIAANIQFPSQLCYLCCQYRVDYFINTGSFFEYKILKRPLTEKDKIRPYNFYAATKIAFAKLLRFYSQHYDLKVINFRLFAPFGERDNEKLIVFLIKSLLQGKTIDFSGGKQRWNFTYVKDIAAAYFRALENFEEISGFEVFNVGCDRAHSIRQVVKKLERIAGKKLTINWGVKPYIDKEIFYTNCDNAKIKKMLKWKPRFDIDAGLEATYDYYLKEFTKEKNGR